MARLHTSHMMTTLSSVGSKIKHGAELLGTLKTAYDTGRMIYGAIQRLAGVALAAA